MKLTEEKKRIVEENKGLVRKVLKDKIHPGSASAYWDYDDLYQIGCIGLCKAAATDNGSCHFSTYAHRLIWNEICDALIHGTRVSRKEILCDPTVFDVSEHAIKCLNKIELNRSLKDIYGSATRSVRTGIDALRLMADGYSSAEIGSRMQLPPNSVRAMASRARSMLKTKPELIALWNGDLE